MVKWDLLGNDVTDHNLNINSVKAREGRLCELLITELIMYVTS